ncbi:transaldolase [Gammaproteobacteria bacterium]|nr:transaldolase [Gammaproteobacteria bacterium]
MHILKTKIFADGANIKEILDLNKNPMIKGFTTNPTLMREAGICDYKDFALEILSKIKDKTISFEVFSDDFNEMYAQAIEIANWGENVYVKIPVTNTKGQSTCNLISKLAKAKVKQNITALMTFEQVQHVAKALSGSPSSYISVFAGRIADTGRDPMKTMKDSIDYLKSYPQLELIWASPRELLNIFQADQIGCHIITATNDILKKCELIGKDLNAFSLETVKMFRNDAIKAGFTLEIKELEYA